MGYPQRAAFLSSVIRGLRRVFYRHIMGQKMHSPTPENYNVAMKAFIRRGDKVLILNDPESQGDLPGGRIGVGEFDVTLEEILRREIAEELGPDFKYKNNGPVALFRHRRPENTLAGKPEIRIFMIGLELEYLSGQIQLSDEHSGYKWLTLEEAQSCLPAGQQNGMAKYIAYLESGRKAVSY